MTGTGTPANPYVVSATAGHLQVTDTSTVDMTLAGNGSATDPHDLSATVKVSTAAVGNLVVAETDGLSVTCEAVQDCVGAGFTGGIIYDDATGQYRAQISAQAGNTLVLSAEDGGLFVPAAAATTASDAETRRVDFDALTALGVPEATASRLTGHTPEAV